MQLAKLTSKNQLTLPKSVTQALGPVQYFEVESRDGQIILTPVRIQRPDALRAKLAALKVDPKTIELALAWGEPVAAKRPRKSTAAQAVPVKPLSEASQGERRMVPARTANLKASLSRVLAKTTKR